jgi:hypothetical protein
MVTANDQGAGETREYTSSIVDNLTAPSMNRFRRSTYAAAHCLYDRLVAETYA